jgi:hypothetical protein
LEAELSFEAPCRRAEIPEGSGSAWMPDAAVMVVPDRLIRAS